MLHKWKYTILQAWLMCALKVSSCSKYNSEISNSGATGYVNIIKKQWCSLDPLLEVFMPSSVQLVTEEIGPKGPQKWILRNLKLSTVCTSSDLDHLKSTTDPSPCLFVQLCHCWTFSPQLSALTHKVENPHYSSWCCLKNLSWCYTQMEWEKIDI